MMSVTGMPQDAESQVAEGRWPPNILLTHSADCQPAGTRLVRNRSGSITGDEPSPVTDAVYGKRGRIPWKAHGTRPGGFGDAGADKGDPVPNGPVYPVEEVQAFTCAPGCPVAGLDIQSGTSSSAVRQGGEGEYYDSSRESWRFRRAAGGFTDTGGASRFYPQFTWDPDYDLPFLYCPKASPAERPKVDGIAHPTCKPVSLIRWLVRLVTPPGGIVLDPFAGTGVTAAACLDEGFRYVLIEREADYMKLIEQRLSRRPPSLFDLEE